MLTKVVTLEYLFISYKKRATKFYIVDKQYFTNLHNSAQQCHLLAVQLTDMRVLLKTLYNGILIEDVWTSFIPLFSIE